MLKNQNMKYQSPLKWIPDKQHYLTPDYNSFPRFLSYYNQYDLVQKIFSPLNSKVLEVGIGNGFLTELLRGVGFDVTTVDICADVWPDHVADVQSLPFPDNSFSCVCCFEVLEHLPFMDFKTCLLGLSRVSYASVILSLPVDCFSWELCFKGTPFGLLRRHLPVFGIHLDVPRFWRKTESREHYWEIGNKGYSIRRIRRVLGSVFESFTEIRPVLDAKHRFFICEVKQ